MTADRFTHPQLAKLMVNAALHMHEFGHKMLVDGKYLPRVQLIAYKENEYGWPAVVQSLLPFHSNSELVEWTSVFSAVKNENRGYDVDDVPELIPLIDEAVSNETLDRAFDPLGLGRRDEQKRDRWVSIGVVRETANLLMRAEALGEVTEPLLQSVYQEWERGHFQDKVTGDLLFPILLTRFDIEARFVVAPGVSIEKIPEDIHKMRALTIGSDEVNPYLASAATHMLVLHDQHFPNSDGPLLRRVRFHAEIPGQDEANRFFQALTNASGEEAGYAQVCLRPLDWATDWTLDLPPFELVSSLVAYPQSFNGGWNGSGVTINAEALKKLPDIFAGLGTTTSRAKLAARRLRQSSMREHQDDIVIDACIGIEALVGEEHDELVHRMSLRASAALSKAGYDAQTAYEVLKKVYIHRSKIVHGTEPKNATINIAGKKVDVVSTAVLLLRRLLEAHLLASPQWSPADLDSDLFDVINTLKPPTA